MAAPLLPAQEPPTYRVPVHLVAAPTTVTNPQGQFVNDLQLGDFRLEDNGRRQNLNREFRNQPISLVVAVQSNRGMRPVKPHIGRIASIIDTLILGLGGEAAIVSFSDQVRTVEVFTSEGEKIRRALRSIDCSGDKSRLVDAVMHSIDLLATRAPNRRRVILLFSHNRDRGSESDLRDAIRDAERHNVIVYSLDVARFHAAGDSLAQPPEQAGMDLKASITQIYRGVRSLASENAAGLLTSYTGGREYSFYKLRSLEQALTMVGEELHGQYLLSYTPLEPTPGFHEIHVRVDRPDVVVRSRPGYWLIEDTH